MNIFEYAARKKLSFGTPLGVVGVGDLWDFPLESKVANRPSLNELAKGLSRQLKELGEEDFVGSSKTSPLREPLEVSLEIIKFVIADKKAAADAVRIRSEKAERRRKILEIVESKQTDELKSKSTEELLKELADLDAA